MSNASVQHFFNYVDRILNSIFRTDLSSKFVGFLLHARAAYTAQDDFQQTLNV